MIRRSFLLGVFLVLISSLGCFSKDIPKTASNARLNLPNWGIIIDATYDKKLDGVVPGYKVMTVALTNRSYDMIKLDPAGDQWFIEDAWGRKQKGIASLRNRDARTWGALPEKVRRLIEYPAGVQMGYTQTFDLFFPQSLELEGFRAISFYSAVMKQNFDALSSQSLERAVPAGAPEGEDFVPDKLKTPVPGSTKKPKSQKY